MLKTNFRLPLPRLRARGLGWSRGPAAGTGSSASAEDEVWDPLGETALACPLSSIRRAGLALVALIPLLVSCWDLNRLSLCVVAVSPYDGVSLLKLLPWKLLMISSLIVRSIISVCVTREPVSLSLTVCCLQPATLQCFIFSLCKTEILLPGSYWSPQPFPCPLPPLSFSWWLSYTWPGCTAVTAPLNVHTVFCGIAAASHQLLTPLQPRRQGLSTAGYFPLQSPLKSCPYDAQNTPSSTGLTSPTSFPATVSHAFNRLTERNYKLISSTQPLPFLPSSCLTMPVFPLWHAPSVSPWKCKTTEPSLAQLKYSSRRKSFPDLPSFVFSKAWDIY